VQAVLSGKAVEAKHERLNPDFPLRQFVRCVEHGRPMTASWSRGRSGRYAYYRHCEGVPKAELESNFETLLASLSLKSRYLALFRETTLRLWKQRHEDAERMLADLRRAWLEFTFDQKLRFQAIVFPDLSRMPPKAGLKPQ
jgi:site-specific DNA recombinase